MERVAEIDIERLEWDDWNRAHIARHGVTPQEVEEIWRGAPIAVRSYKQRIVLIGPTRTGTMLAAAVGPVPGQPGSYYTFSARPASRKERRYYQDQQGAEP